MTTAELIDVVRLEPGNRDQWQAFVSASDNATLFHDLDFLAYHPADRFEEHHLLFYHRGELVAALPGAIVPGANGARRLASPYGASVGGIVLPEHQGVELSISLCQRLQQYVRELGVAGIDMRIGPGYYNRSGGDRLGFALAASGFTLTQRWICPAIRLPQAVEDVIKVIPLSKRRSSVRTALAKGLCVRPAGIESLPEFYGVLERNRAKHQARPTHTEEELRWLLETLPERIRLFICTLSDEIVGGTVMFDLNDRVSYWFYPCHDDRFSNYRPPSVVLYRVLEEYTRRGFLYVDLGPTGDVLVGSGPFHLNEGNLFFKQEMGGVGHCRDAWKWECDGHWS
jgi:CelD/BcsL family acetyltransferase involved in cellulose biosynthesis